MSGPAELSAPAPGSPRLRTSLWCAIGVALGAGLTAVLRSVQRAEPGSSAPPSRAAPYWPAVDRAKLDALVLDGPGPDRVALEPEALALLLPAARQLGADAGPARGALELGAEALAALEQDPSARRGEPCVARGWIETLREERCGPEGAACFLGRLRLEDRSRAYFLVLEPPQGTAHGDFARVDGLFMKLFSDEDPDQRGLWIDGPLLVGRRLQGSMPALPELQRLDAPALAALADDDLETGLSGLPSEALWTVLSYARRAAPGAVDWAAAPELNRQTLQAVMEGGANHRYDPFRIPSGALQAVSVKDAGENPARLEHLTEGWIGDPRWGQAFKFIAPFDLPGARVKDRVSGRGLFLKNVAYEPQQGGQHVAPLFVLTDLRVVDRPSDTLFVTIGIVIASSTAALVLFFAFLVMRDKGNARLLQDRLVARRRARRGAPA